MNFWRKGSPTIGCRSHSCHMDANMNYMNFTVHLCRALLFAAFWFFPHFFPQWDTRFHQFTEVIKILAPFTSSPRLLMHQSQKILLIYRRGQQLMMEASLVLFDQEKQLQTYLESYLNLRAVQRRSSTTGKHKLITLLPPFKVVRFGISYPCCDDILKAICSN